MNGFAELINRLPADERETVAGVVEIVPSLTEEQEDGFDLVVHRARADGSAQLWLIAAKHYRRKDASATAQRVHAVRELLWTWPAERVDSERDALAGALVKALLDRALDRWITARHDTGADFLLVDPPTG
ncbi:hypothetical protein ACIQJX_40615 [Streptomyces griseoviridis]|uniref:hypothetical protein n=1 Tax=Streptomyces griseoviridis TaxID=45398 RepID=UPI00341BB25F